MPWESDNSALDKQQFCPEESTILPWESKQFCPGQATVLCLSCATLIVIAVTTFSVIIRIISFALLSLLPLIDFTCALPLTGDARAKLSLPRESLLCYEAALSHSPLDSIALKGVADSCLALAYQLYSSGSVGEVARYLAKGIKSLDQILEPSFMYNGVDNTCDNNGDSGCGGVDGDNGDDGKQHGAHLRSVWKLLGDLCCFARNIGPRDVHCFIKEYSFELSGESSDESSDGLMISGLGSSCPTSYAPLFLLLRKGEQAYRRALALQLSQNNGGDKNGSVNDETQKDSTDDDNSSHCYYDIGYALYLQGVVTLQSTGQGSGVLFQPSSSSSTASSSASSPPTSDSLSQSLFLEAKTFFLQGEEEFLPLP